MTTTLPIKYWELMVKGRKENTRKKKLEIGR